LLPHYIHPTFKDEPLFKQIAHPTASPPEVRAALMASPAFGKVFTDHMVTIRWSESAGWHDGKVGPREPFTLDPAAAVLHYAQEIFEGLKAYRAPDGGVRLFRPRENARRFARSAERMAMPPLPEDMFIAAVQALVRTDVDWLPTGDGTLYLRPFMFASEAFLGVRPAVEYIFCVIACPVGAYFKAGSNAIAVWVSSDYSRAGSGGTGAAKCGGNYAASLQVQAEAFRNGCEQVLFLDAAEHRWVEEFGGMNVFFVFDDGTLRTPRLGGTILPGITRDSILTLARDNAMQVEEAPYAFDEWTRDAASGRLREVFACGTAAVVLPIGEVRYAGGAMTVAGGAGGQVTARLREQLLGIQRGSLPDPHNWSHLVELR
jgi:branched-chain amino acid aminotransferase